MSREHVFCTVCDSKLSSYSGKCYSCKPESRIMDRPKKEKEIRIIRDKICPTCSIVFTPNNDGRQKFCCSECKPKEKTEAEKWLTKLPPAKRDGQHVAYGFFAIRSCSIKSSYRPCRG